MLHNKEYHEMNKLFNQCKAAVEQVLQNSEVYQRTQNYLKLANDNIDRVSAQIKENNLFYEGAHSFKFYFNKEALISSSYEIRLSFRDKYDKYRSASIGIDTFIILLDECGLIKDTED